MTVTPIDSGTPAYRDPGRSPQERLEDLLARMTREEKVAQLGSAWVFQIARGHAARARARSRVLRNGIGHITRISGASSLRPEEAARARQRDPALPRRGDPARHPGDRPRGDLLRADGARRDGLPAGDRPCEHVGPGARRGAGRGDRRPDARGRRPPRPRSRPGRVPRSALGPHRGDVRRGSVSRRPDGRRVRARAPGRVAARRRDRHGEALRRVRRLGRRDELGAGRHSAAGAAGGVPPSVRGGRPGRPRRLRDERVQRARRRRPARPIASS